MKIEIFLNGESRRIPVGSTVADLVNSLDLASRQVAVEYNRKILRREHWGQQVILDGDRIEIVHFVGGGAPRELFRDE